MNVRPRGLPHLSSVPSQRSGAHRREAAVAALSAFSAGAVIQTSISSRLVSEARTRYLAPIVMLLEPYLKMPLPGNDHMHILLIHAENYVTPPGESSASRQLFRKEFMIR